MAEITQGGRTLYCMDRWEASLWSGDRQVHPQQQAAEVELRSVAGVEPVLGLTFDQAKQLCEASPVRMRGEHRGHKRMPLLQEWLDAADGRVGEGGSVYPYGDDFVPGRCNFGQGRDGRLQPTGSLGDCQSAFGVYDLLGNAFEWVDSGQRIDMERSLERFAAAELRLSVGAEGCLTASEEADLTRLVSGATTIDADSLRREDNGCLSMGHTATTRRNPTGILHLRDEPVQADNALPVLFRTQHGTERAVLELYEPDDGAVITVKIGGAFYAGTEWPSPKMNHTHDFNGTIAPRCVSDPS
jgi:hypothetical protein